MGRWRIQDRRRQGRSATHDPSYGVYRGWSNPALSRTASPSLIRRPGRWSAPPERPLDLTPAGRPHQPHPRIAMAGTKMAGQLAEGPHQVLHLRVGVGRGDLEANPDLLGG